AKRAELDLGGRRKHRDHNVTPRPDHRGQSISDGYQVAAVRAELVDHSEGVGDAASSETVEAKDVDAPHLSLRDGLAEPLELGPGERMPTAHLIEPFRDGLASRRCSRLDCRPLRGSVLTRR